MTPDNKFGGSFGPNEWLVDEMYEQYLKDPNSVDENWKIFFAGRNGAPKPSTPPTPKREQVKVEPVAPTPVAPAPVAQVVTPQQTPAPQTVRQAAQPAPTPAQPVAKPVKEISTPTAARVEPLRGVANRVVQSMEASLTVPTATSVRAIPAKLMIDNRTVKIGRAHV